MWDPGSFLGTEEGSVLKRVWFPALLLGDSVSFMNVVYIYASKKRAGGGGVQLIPALGRSRQRQVDLPKFKIRAARAT